MSSNVDSTIHASSFLTAAQACRLLGIRPATLYSYVSRGLLESHPAEKAGRKRRYARDDVVRLKARHDARSGHAPVAASALRWGEPVLDSAVTEITPDGPSYRGRLAIDLVRAGEPFESVAELLWTGALPGAHPAWPAPARFGRVPTGPGARTPLPRLPALLSAIAAGDETRFAVAGDRELARARAIVAALPFIVSPERYGRASRTGAIAVRICELIGRGATDARVRAVDAALVASADHELNVSSFATRVVASAGADLHACLAAAAAGLTGPLHGGANDRVEGLLDDIGRVGSAQRALEARARRGEPLPGLGHTLYPGGDPRATALLEVAARLANKDETVRLLRSVARAGDRYFGLRPTLDLGLVAVASALGAPRGTAGAFFAIGRSAGWVAHVIEQREAGHLLRPRARYVGASVVNLRSGRAGP